MSFQINTNVPSLQAQENLRQSSDFQAKTISRVTSGLRIVTSGDDAAGLAIANGIRSDIAVLGQGIRNANDALSQLQIIDGGMNNISKLLDRARSLATQSASGTFTGDRNVLNNEFQSVLQEIDRQAQTIGLNSGGVFAKALNVFIGGGKTSGNINSIQNGSVAIDLSSSLVDAQSLGLAGVRATGAAGTDISTSSASSVQYVLADATNVASLATGGFSDFYFRGAGFSDDSRVKVSLNLQGVTDTATLVTALNSAITNSGNGPTAAATAFRNTNIKAVVVNDVQPDGSIKQRLGFISSNAAFQVEAGDRMSNALLGQFVSGATGKAIGNTFVGAAVTATGATVTSGAGAANLLVRIQGSGLPAPVDLTVGITRGTTTAAQIYAALSTAVASNAQLQAAGVTLDSPVPGSALAFRNSRGGRFDVQVAGDQDNILGLGTFQASSATATAFDYTSITGSVATVATSSTQSFEFSLSGGAKTSITIGTLGGGTIGIAAASAGGAANALNAAFAANATLNAAGFQATVNAGAITITNTTGTAFRLNAIATGVSGTIGFGSATSNGAGTAFTANYNDAVYSATAGGTFNIGTSNNVISFSLNGGAATTFTINTGGTQSVTNVVTDLNSGFGTNATATQLNNNIVITTASNTKLSLLNSGNSALTTVGFNIGQSNYADKFTANAGGIYNTAVGQNNDVFNWNALLSGNSDQTISVVVVDPNGAQRSLSVVLQNDNSARNARSLDEAIKTINNALLTSGDPYLKQIVAVKEQNATGNQEGVRFISTIKNFRVSLGLSASSTAANEVGIFDGTSGTTALGQGVINSAVQSTGGSQLDVSTLETAQSAVTALADAVTSLGRSQATIGRGQNAFNYAVNLASSQTSNMAAAESRIRDADLAVEAANLTKAQISIQAGVAALAQANSTPQAILQLLRGQ